MRKFSPLIISSYFSGGASAGGWSWTAPPSGGINTTGSQIAVCLIVRTSLQRPVSLLRGEAPPVSYTTRRKGRPLRYPALAPLERAAVSWQDVGPGTR